MAGGIASSAISGKGAMGLVYMAYDPVLDRKVAIKQMTAEIADNEELRQRFYVEARAAARLNHPEHHHDPRTAGSRAATSS